MRSWMPDAEHIAEEIAAYQGGWLGQMSIRIPASISLQTFVFLIWQVWRVTGLMLVGMALLKWGVLSASRSRRFYLTSMLVGFLVGYPLILLGVYRNFAAGWSLEYSMFYGPQLNYWGSILVAFGYVCMVMLLARAARPGTLTRALAATGRMAFTNYIMQTLLCTTVFYGHGLGLYARMERTEQILVVFSIWVLQLIVSPIWLKHFRFGPLEWLWRSLTYRSRQPMRIRTEEAN